MISSFLALVIAVSAMVVPASAVSPGVVIEGVGVIATLWDVALDSYNLWLDANPGADPSEYPGYNPGGSFGGGASREELYQQYLDGLQNDLGSTILTDGGFRIPYPSYTGSGVNDGIRRIIDMPSNPLGRYSSVYMQFVKQNSDGTLSTSYTFTWTGNTEGLTLPYDAYVTGGYTTWGNATVVPKSDRVLLENVLIYAGNEFGMCTDGNAPYLTARVPSDVTFCDFGAMLYVDVYPVSGLSSVTGSDVSNSSRPSSIIGDYGIIGDDGNITKIDGNVIVDESTSTVYNPVTNTTYSYTNCAFDYSTLTYNLTLEDGSTLKVVYGDENITINEGDTVYNVYYLMSDSGSGGSGGSGSDGGGSGDGSGVGDAVSGLLGGLGNILAGLIEGLLKMAAQAVEALGGLIDIFNGLVDMILGFFGGFTSFLGSMFPFLPEETFVILNFGLILLIAAAVIKKLFL